MRPSCQCWPAFQIPDSVFCGTGPPSLLSLTAVCCSSLIGALWKMLPVTPLGNLPQCIWMPFSCRWCVRVYMTAGACVPRYFGSQELQLLVAGAPSTLGSTDQRQIVMLVLKYALTDPLVDSRGTGNAFWPLWQIFPNRWPSTGISSRVFWDRAIFEVSSLTIH